jgi:putative FmdB family regulatory protein
MPLREYQCDACGHRFEVIQKMSDPPLEVCPKCGGVIHKLQAAPAFHLKGTGWYATDYAKKDQSSEGKKDSDSKRDGDSKKDGDSKRDSDSKESAAGSTDKGESKPDTAKSPASTESASGSSTSTSTSTPSSTKHS